MRRALSIALGVTLLVTVGCVRTPRFRYVQKQPECFPKLPEDPLPGVPGEKRLWPSLDCRNTLYTVGFIEFDDHGRPIDPLQETKALALIDEARKKAPGGKIIAVVYVHGWKNNASEAEPGGKPKDVEKFRSALAELGLRSQVAKGPGDPIPVIGIYMAWRGKSVMGPTWFTFISLWGRRNAANRVGEGDAFASSLTNVIKKVNEPLGGVETGSRIALVGHSFGARVLEHAIETKSIQLFNPIEGANAATPIVDLALYVNSANDARLSMTRLLQLREKPIVVRHPDYTPEECATGDPNRPRCRDYPLLVAITSRGDTATKYLLPAANTLNLDKSVKSPASPTGTFLDRTPSSGAYRKHAAAHMKFLQSHVARDVSCESTPREACPAGDSQCRFVFRTQNDQPACFQIDQRAPGAGPAPTGPAAGVTPAPLPFNTTAFWIMDVDPSVIKDHGDIWNVSFIEMLGQLMAPRGFFEPRVGRVQLRAAPPR
jgi:hypothetical protein